MIEEQQYKTVDEVLNIDTTELLGLKIGDEREDMSIYCMARWLALINGIEVINKKAVQLKID